MAAQVALSSPRAGVIEAVVFDGWGQTILTRTLTTEGGDFACEAGHAIFRRPSIEGEDVVALIGTITVDLVPSADYLVAQVKRQSIGIILLVPLAVESKTLWVRFKRLHE